MTVGIRMSAEPVRRAAAFTIVELLVVIAIVAVVVSIAVPAYRHVSGNARLSMEMSAARQMAMAWNSYAADSKSWILPGFKTGLPAFQEDGTTIPASTYGGGATIAARFPWRLAPYLGHNFYGMYVGAQREELDDLKNGPREEFLYFASLYPSFGLNSTFVGGDQERYGFLPNPPAPFKGFYVSRLSSVRRPDQLLLCASSRTGATDDGRMVEGYFRLEAPSIVAPQWAAEYDPTDPASFGNVSARHAGAAVCAFTGGHVDSIRVDQLKDMRHWANGATAPDWTLAP